MSISPGFFFFGFFFGRSKILVYVKSLVHRIIIHIYFSCLCSFHSPTKRDNRAAPVFIIKKKKKNYSWLKDSTSAVFCPLHHPFS